MTLLKGWCQRDLHPNSNSPFYLVLRKKPISCKPQWQAWATPVAGKIITKTKRLMLFSSRENTEDLITIQLETMTSTAKTSVSLLATSAHSLQGQKDFSMNVHLPACISLSWHFAPQWKHITFGLSGSLIVRRLVQGAGLLNKMRVSTLALSLTTYDLWMC